MAQAALGICQTTITRAAKSVAWAADSTSCIGNTRVSGLGLGENFLQLWSVDSRIDAG